MKRIAVVIVVGFSSILFGWFFLQAAWTGEHPNWPPWAKDEAEIGDPSG
jgi:hypothetical protein